MHASRGDNSTSRLKYYVVYYTEHLENFVLTITLTGLCLAEWLPLGAVLPLIALAAVTEVVPGQVKTTRAHPAGVRITTVHVNLTILSRVTIATDTLVAGDNVMALASVLAGVAAALVDVGLAMSPRVTRQASAYVAVD